MRSAIGLVLLASAAAFATGCASNPEPAPTPVAAAPVTAPPTPPTTQPPPRVTPPPTPAGPANGSKAQFTATAQDRVFFGYDEYNLTDEAKRSLQAQANWLNQYSRVRVQIEGNADERGTREYNMALGERRAQAVKAYLGTLGVNASRIDVHSWGKDNPLDPGHTDSSWSRNRNAYTNVVSEQTS
jgi:peptidoglycan-associated lipoprotein